MLAPLKFTLIFLVLLSLNTSIWAAKQKSPETLQCAAFSPYVGQLSPDYGAPPSHALIDTLLNTLIKETPFRCISTYGVLNGLEYVFAAAERRHIKVIATLWLDKDLAVNTQSIASGIAAAKAYPATIIKLSCGNEVRTRHGYALDGEISRCIHALRDAGVKQPITAIDTWWEWCNRTTPCHITSLGKEVDWIGINVFPWWENVFSDTLPCIPAKQAATFHLARMQDVQQTYPKTPVVLTEFGWPKGPEGAVAVNIHSKQDCGEASSEHQLQVVKETFQQLAQKHWTGVVFEAFSEQWKPDNEGHAGGYWGLCDGTPPYRCPGPLKNLLQ